MSILKKYNVYNYYMLETPKTLENKCIYYDNFRTIDNNVVNGGALF